VLVLVFVIVLVLFALDSFDIERPTTTGNSRTVLVVDFFAVRRTEDDHENDYWPALMTTTTGR
jgi:hypothetical protein